GAIDILVVNCGGPPPGAGLDVPPEEWPRAVQSTLLPAIDWTNAVIPVMSKKKWGRIVVIMSISIKQPIDGLILSNTMRAGVAGFAKSISRELAPRGILINVVCPGSHRTDRLQALAEKRAKDAGIPLDEQWKLMAGEIPVGRLGTPEEFGNVVAFLASERASYVTGTTIQVDGGLYRGLL
ncbi:MAG: SDR family oxidoreductase, partial [Planctomycetota bacterium]